MHQKPYQLPGAAGNARLKKHLSQIGKTATYKTLLSEKKIERQRYGIT